MKLLIAITLLAVAGMASAECPEACSGHGFCGEFDKCSCWRNWMGNSCADRVCPYDLAYVDLPLGDLDMSGARTDLMLEMAAHVNERVKSETWPSGMFFQSKDDGHFYAECSNKGMCDRKSGLCSCFDGFEGTACRRTVCPNECSGHGTCETMEELAAAAGHTYTLWDRYKMQVCKCDPQWFGIDCSLLHCPYGDDPLTTKQADEVQYVEVSAESALGGTFRLTYVDEYGETWDTMPIAAQDFDWTTVANNANWATSVQKALQGIPNSVFEAVLVEAQPVEQPLPGVVSKAADGITWDVAGSGTVNELIHGNQLDFLTSAPSTKKVISNCKANADQKKVDIGADTLNAEKLTCGDTTSGANFDAFLCHSAKHGIRAKVTFTTNPGNINNLGCNKALTTGTNAACTSNDVVVLTAACGRVDSGDKITSNFDIGDFASVGDRVNCGGDVFTIKTAPTSPTATANSEAAVEEAIGADVAITTHSAPAFSLHMSGTKELVECSHRGLCNFGEGLCECFNGYTNDDCGAQDALSA